MSASWLKRKTRLNALLGEQDNEDAQGLALDRIIHGQSVIGKTARTTQIDDLKFGDKDLDVLGTLEYGQYGIIDVVTCKLDGKVYVRKSIEKRLAVKTQDQCSPQLERDILLRALKSKSVWAPHLLCAFQTDTHLNIVMDYAEGGTLWDVLESSPHDGRILEADLCWWMPQIVSAIDWCHSQGFAHRDIKPHNFVLNTNARILLIDFGSAAPLLPRAPDGSQSVPKRYCAVPCGTCDYISPEILQCHEEALVEMEMADNSQDLPLVGDYEPGGYGRETDWWSFGAMIYEMVYGVAPFFANDIRQTYLKIVDHYRSLRFKSNVRVSSELQDLIRRLLTSPELRLGRQSTDEIKSHPFFDLVDWDNMRKVNKARLPEGLHLPQFTYAMPSSAPSQPELTTDTASLGDSTSSRAFAFSTLFHSSPASTPALSVLQPTPSQKSSRSILRERALSSFIGFSWGPSIDAFKDADKPSPTNQNLATPRVLKPAVTPQTARIASIQATPQRYPFATPVRPSAMTPFAGTGTLRRTAPRRAVSDREAMKQLVNCVGMSARKKVLESGRKPRILTSGSRSRSSTLKELRFDRSVMVFNGDSGGVSYRMDPTTTTTTTTDSGGGMSLSLMSASTSSSARRLAQQLVPSETESSMETDAPYSPSPSPRPGSVMSVMSRRSHTPGANSGSYVLKLGHASMPSTDSKAFLSPSLPVDPEWPIQNKQLLTEVFLSQSVSYDALDELERRHGKLMRDIAGISSRLSEASLHISSGAG